MNEEFERLIRTLGDAVYSKIQSDLDGKNWVRAFLEVRYDPSGKSWFSKIRATIPDGQLVSVGMNNDIDNSLILMRSFRKSFGDEWYGLVFLISIDGRCKIEFNYDPNCSEEKSFFDT